jgi:hypothetical protein
MSLAIDVDRVSQVLLSDGWHTVVNKSFTLDSYEYIWHHEGSKDSELMHGGGSSGVCATGFSFQASPQPGSNQKAGELIAGPLTAIQAVRHTRPS